MRNTLSQHRFVVLLQALVLFMLATPVVQLLGPSRLASGVLTVLFLVMICMAAFAVSTRRRTGIVTVSLVVPVFIFQWLNLALDWHSVEIARLALGIVFLSYIVAVILRYLFATERVTFDVICASLCVYILLGVVWALGYSLLESIAPHSFAFSLADPADSVTMEFGGERTVFALYYSFVTMTTLGYGDIVPTTSLARMVAVVQAVTGQLYLVVLVARLVGLHIVHASSPKS